MAGIFFKEKNFRFLAVLLAQQILYRRSQPDAFWQKTSTGHNPYGASPIWHYVNYKPCGCCKHTHQDFSQSPQ